MVAQSVDCGCGGRLVRLGKSATYPLTACEARGLLGLMPSSQWGHLTLAARPGTSRVRDLLESRHVTS
jgi:hypothetical protein